MPSCIIIKISRKARRIRNMTEKERVYFMNEPRLMLCEKNDLSFFSHFSSLWNLYIDELSQYSKRLKEEPVTKGEVLSMWYNPDIELYLVLLDENPIGFLLLGINKNKHEFSDWFIGEFYIAKNHQSKGIGKKVIGDLLGRKKGSYCLFILHKNHKALKFWDKVFTESEYINTTERFFCGHTPEDCYFKVYEPKDAAS